MTAPNRTAVPAPSTEPVYDDRGARFRLLARAILMDYGVPPPLAVACGRALLVDDHAGLEAMCVEAWGADRLEDVLAARGGAA